MQIRLVKIQRAQVVSFKRAPTYMGHAEIFYTYWYLTAVPELMALAGGKFECFANLMGDGNA